MPIQIYWKFYNKKENFQVKFGEAVLNSTHNRYLKQNKKIIYTHINHSFTI